MEDSSIVRVSPSLRAFEFENTLPRAVLLQEFLGLSRSELWA